MDYKIIVTELKYAQTGSQLQFHEKIDKNLKIHLLLAHTAVISGIY